MDPKDLTILHVEDDEGDRELLSRYLADTSWHGATLLAATSAEEALTKVKTSRVHVMLLDFQIGMPDGLELLKTLLDQTECDLPSVVMITGQGDETLAARAVKIGAVDYLPKRRLDPSSLQCAIQDAVEALDSREQARRYRIQLEILARTDGLTGLRNRHALMQDFLHEIARAARYGRPLSVLVLDLDHFKKVNDSYGHPAGDEVLVGVGQILNDLVRQSDIAGRLGGEEFCLVLPETTPEQALAVAEKIRLAVEESAFQDPEAGEFRVTCSLGLAGRPEGESASEAFDATRLRQELYRAADRALYRAKTEGRNRVAVAHPDDSYPREDGTTA